MDQAAQRGDPPARVNFSHRVSMRLFIANVGVNAGDAVSRGLRSPIFPDGTFEFVPIKEPGAFASCSCMPRYADLRSWTGRAANLGAFVPERIKTYRPHLDPEFETFTYGDVLSPRAANLAAVAVGDDLWFLARLWAHDGSRWTGASDFYFIGRFEVELNILVPASTIPGNMPDEVEKRIRANAHYRRLLCGGGSAFRIVAGQLERSCRFARPLRVTPEVVGLIYGGTYQPDKGTFHRGGQVLRNLNGKERRLGTFGSVTRSIQAFLSSDDSEQRDDLEALTRLGIGCGKAR